MTAPPSPSPAVRRVVLLPAAPHRGDELVRRYRIARVRAAGPAGLPGDATAAAASPRPEAG